MMKVLHAAVAAIASTICIVLPATAQSVYSWKDDKGVIHYGDRPLQSGAAKHEVKTRAGGCQDAACYEREAREARARTADSNRAIRQEQALDARERAARQANQQSEARALAQAKKRADLQKRCEEQRRVGCDTDQGLRNMHNDENQARVRVIRTYR